MKPKTLKYDSEINYYNAIPYIPILGVAFYYIFRRKIDSFDYEPEMILQVIILFIWHIVSFVLVCKML